MALGELVLAGLADVEVARRGRGLALPIPIQRGLRLGVGGDG